MAQMNEKYDIPILYDYVYNYIKHDSINVGKRIAVSDSIIDLDRIWDIKDIVGEKDVNSCREEKEYEYFKPYHSFLLTKLHEANKLEPDMILFFSPIENDMLQVDLYSFESSFQYNYDLYMWGECVQYLFILNKKGEIDKVLKQRLYLN